MTSGPAGRDAALGARPGHPPSWAPVGIARSEGTVVVALGGVLDPSGTGWLEHLLADLVDGQGNRSVAVDVGEVAEVDVSVLAVLVAFSARAARRGGCLVLREPSAAILAQLAELAEVAQAGLDRAIEFAAPSPSPSGPRDGSPPGLPDPAAVARTGLTARSPEATLAVDDPWARGRLCRGS